MNNYLATVEPQSLVTHRRKLIQLVDHTATLAAHTQTAGLAGIVRCQRFCSVFHADTTHGIQGVEDFLKATANDLLVHRVISVCRVNDKDQ